jgi:SET domain-containing protein
MHNADKPLFEVRRSGIQGKGAFAIRPIKKGARIIEYTGERISDEEAGERYDDDKMKRHHTFLFQLDDGTCIDAASGGNEARFINHSCRPNCIAYQIGKRIFIYARKNIRPEEELVYDYKFERDGVHRSLWKKLYACYCGADNCRGTILNIKRKKPASTAKKRATAAR